MSADSAESFEITIQPHLVLNGKSHAGIVDQLRSGLMVFDIETVPLPLNQLLAIMPPWEDPGDFDPETVRHGNTTDPEKRREKIEKSRDKWEQERESLRNQHTTKFLSNATLDPLRSHVGAIVYCGPSGLPLVHMADEREMLTTFWLVAREVVLGTGRLAGWSSNQFDLPYLIKRSWMLNVHVTPGVLDDRGYLHRGFVDMQRIWSFGNQEKFAKLNDAALSLGIPGKTGTGATWHQTIQSDPPLGLKYLVDEGLLHWRIAERLMG